jgi:diacylglycerol kinase family enzyme
VRALLIVNPHATSTTQVRKDVIAHALASKLDLEVVQTRYRGHAARVAEAAAQDGYGLVLTLGGDGTVNEAVNGLLRAHPPASAPAGVPVPVASAGGPQPASAPPGGPLLAALPGGNANVFTRALGLPPDPVDATGWILASLSGGRTRTVGLGLADDRYFCFNAGLGLDAEVVRIVEGLRARGRPASAALYVWAAVRQFSSVTNRREPALTLERDGAPAVDELFLGLVSNTCPWTYLGDRPVRASPEAGFDTGLDLLALRSLSTFGTLNAIRQMLGLGGGPTGRHVVTLHDQDTLMFRATRPVAVQLDGEYVGEREHVMLRSIPNALRVVV